MVRPEIYGLSGSSEFQAAVRLQHLFETDTLPSESGIIGLHIKPHMGQQLDVFLHGYFPMEFSRQLLMPDSSETEQIRFLDVIATIEVKAHGKGSVELSDTSAIVFYGDKPSDARDQSHMQAIRAKEFIHRTCGFTPWVCNIIFFPHLVKGDLPSSRFTNYLAADSTLEDLLEILCIHNPRLTQGQGRVFSCTGLDEKEVQARHEQLQAKLGRFQQGVPQQTKRQAINSPYQVVRPETPVLPLQTKYSKIPKYLFFLLAAIFALFLMRHIVFISADALHSMHTRFGQSQRLAQTAVTTCMSLSPSCGWQTQSTYRRGMTIYFHFEGLGQDVLSVRIQNPRGDTSILPFHKAPRAPDEKATYLAKMPLDHRALTGTYSVTTDARDTTSQVERSFTEHFTVEP